MRIYISGAISGTTDYIERFKEAQVKLEKKGYSVFNPVAIASAMPEELTYEEHMKINLFILNACDGIYMLKGWEKSLGANREYGYALGADMAIEKEGA